MVMKNGKLHKTQIWSKEPKVLLVAYSQASIAVPKLDAKFKAYEVVQAGHSTRQWRGFGLQSEGHPTVGQMDIQIDGSQHTVLLSKRTNLFGPDYREQRHHYKDGKLVAPVKTRLFQDTAQSKDCWYGGHVMGQQASSSVTMDTCSGGFSGLLFLQGNGYGVEPAHKHLSSGELLQYFNYTDDAEAGRIHHVVYKLEDRISEHKFGCGVKDDFFYDATKHTHGHGEDEETALGALLETMKAHGVEARENNERRLLQTEDRKYVELVIVSDKMRYDDATGEPEAHAVTIVNLVNGIYEATEFDPLITISLVGQVAFPVEDPWASDLVLGSCVDCSSQEAGVDELLSLFNAFRTNPANIPTHDNAQLFSGHDFSGYALGYAAVGAMCDVGRSSGIDMVSESMGDALSSGVVAHELGHNFGMSHDSSSNTCPESGFIMNAVVDPSSAPTVFSDCSIFYLREYLKDETKVCIDNEPTTRWGDAICGNGYIEEGEDCDCGSTDCTLSENTCCNGTSCLFLDGAACSETDACCENCQVLTDTSLICRESSGGCDLQETCDGVNGACPVDSFRGSGTKCDEGGYGDGLCYSGFCYSHLRQCRVLGSAYVEGPFDECPYTSQATLNGWQSGNDKSKEAFFCDTLWCQNTPDACTFFRLSSTISVVDDGVPCSIDGADGDFQCLNSQCERSSVLNTQYEWVGSAWTNCPSCDIPQYRNVSCHATGGDEDVDERLCSPNNKIATVQDCQNETLACTFANGLADDEIDLFGFVVTGNTILFGTLGAVSFFLVILACCYQAVTYGDDDFQKMAPESVTRDPDAGMFG